MPTHSRKTILLATDQQRSVLSALDEHPPRSIAYTPYGHRPRENGLLSLLGFNGELPDPRTGCYHLGNGYRQFNPVLMRFICPDRFSPFGKGGLNAYAYCEGDPSNKVDPTGEFGQLINVAGMHKLVPLRKLAPTPKQSTFSSVARNVAPTAPSKKNAIATVNANVSEIPKNRISSNNSPPRAQTTMPQLVSSQADIKLKMDTISHHKKQVSFLNNRIFRVDNKLSKAEKLSRHSHNDSDEIRYSNELADLKEEKNYNQKKINLYTSLPPNEAASLIRNGK
jgi:RHS repeat-associated protein